MILEYVFLRSIGWIILAKPAQLCFDMVYFPLKWEILQPPLLRAGEWKRAPVVDIQYMKKVQTYKAAYQAVVKKKNKKNKLPQWFVFVVYLHLHLFRLVRHESKFRYVGRAVLFLLEITQLGCKEQKSASNNSWPWKTINMLSWQMENSWQAVLRHGKQFTGCLEMWKTGHEKSGREI